MCLPGELALLMRDPSPLLGVLPCHTPCSSDDPPPTHLTGKQIPFRAAPPSTAVLYVTCPLVAACGNTACPCGLPQGSGT